MTYLVPIHAQIAVFCKMAGFGFLLGAAYDLVRFLRLAVNSRYVLPWDVVFGALAAPPAFLFALTQNGGRIRLHLLFALAVGMGVWLRLACAPFRRAGNRLLRLRGRVRVRMQAFQARLRALEKKWASGLKKIIKKSKFPIAIRTRHGV